MNSEMQRQHDNAYHELLDALERYEALLPAANRSRAIAGVVLVHLRGGEVEPPLATIWSRWEAFQDTMLECMYATIVRPRGAMGLVEMVELLLAAKAPQTLDKKGT